MLANEHTSRQFDAELEAVRGLVMQMGCLVKSQLGNAVEALTTGNVELMSLIIARDHHINALEVEISERCTTIIARRQPTANDLRLITMVVKTITDLERAGDEAKRIALMGKSVTQAGRISLPCSNEIRHAAQLATDMLHKSLAAFSSLDIATVSQIVREDDRVDEEFHSILRYLVSFMMEDPRTISIALDILFIAKAIERIGDHAKNMAEYVVYMVKGRDVRHVTIEEIERETRERN